MADEMELLQLFRDEIPGPTTDAWARARAAIAAARAEEAPAGHRHGRRPGRRRMFSITAGLALAAAVAILLAVVLPGWSAGPGRLVSTGQVRETAYVVNRVRHSLGASAQGNAVGYARTVYPPGSARGLEVTANRGGLDVQPGSGPASRLLVELNAAGQTLVLVTHSPDLAARYARRTVQLLDGRIASDTAGAAVDVTAAGGRPGAGARP